MSGLAQASCQLTRVRDANSRSAKGWPRNRTKYTYDAAGHTEGYGSLSFTYNNRGRMEATSASSTDYLYNALGQMIEKSGTLGTTAFMQDEAGHLIGEYDGSGNLIEETIWLGDIPVATLQPNGSGGVNIYYIHTDHLNAPRKVQQPVTDALVWRWDTDPFGTAAPNENPSGLGTFPYNLRFPGQYYDAETGLLQNWNRDYDPVVGRYIESDPIGLRGGINTYAYTASKPLLNVDPSGLFLFSPTFFPGILNGLFHKDCPACQHPVTDWECIAEANGIVLPFSAPIGVGTYVGFKLGGFKGNGLGITGALLLLQGERDAYLFCTKCEKN
jgi:RHS repeat-associated protein